MRPLAGLLAVACGRLAAPSEPWEPRSACVLGLSDPFHLLGADEPPLKRGCNGWLRNGTHRRPNAPARSGGIAVGLEATRAGEAVVLVGKVLPRPLLMLLHFPDAADFQPVWDPRSWEAGAAGLHFTKPPAGAVGIEVKSIAQIDDQNGDGAWTDGDVVVAEYSVSGRTWELPSFSDTSPNVTGFGTMEFATGDGKIRLFVSPPEGASTDLSAPLALVVDDFPSKPWPRPTFFGVSAVVVSLGPLGSGTPSVNLHCVDSSTAGHRRMAVQWDGPAFVGDAPSGVRASVLASGGSTHWRPKTDPERVVAEANGMGESDIDSTDDHLHIGFDSDDTDFIKDHLHLRLLLTAPLGNATSVRYGFKLAFSPPLPTRLPPKFLVLLAYGALVAGSFLGCAALGVCARRYRVTPYSLWLLATRRPPALDIALLDCSGCTSTTCTNGYASPRDQVTSQ